MNREGVKYLLTIVVVHLCRVLYAQDQNELTMSMGIFRSFDDFKNNIAIPWHLIRIESKPDNTSIYPSRLSRARIEFTDGDTTISSSTAGIWGYNDGKRLYVSLALFLDDIEENAWVPVFELGSISVVHILKYKKPSYSPGAPPSPSAKMIPYLIDMSTNRTCRATLANLEKLINSDRELLKEYENSKAEKEEKLYFFVRKFNARHPLKIGK